MPIFVSYFLCTILLWISSDCHLVNNGDAVKQWNQKPLQSFNPCLTLIGFRTTGPWSVEEKPKLGEGRKSEQPFFLSLSQLLFSFFAVVVALCSFLSPSINKQILHTDLHTFFVVLFGRIC